MSFNQTLHIEQDVAERLDMYWDFRPSTGAVRNQNYAVLSIVAPDGTNQRAPSFGIKIFGCFPTHQEATEYSKKLQKECNFFDYYVMDTMEWAKLPPVVEKLEDVHYQEEELESLKNNVIKMRENRAKIMEERVLEARQDAKKKSLASLTGGDDDDDAAAAVGADGGVEESKGETAEAPALVPLSTDA